MKVSLFITCFNETRFPETGRVVVSLLERLGHEIDLQRCAKSNLTFPEVAFVGLTESQAKEKYPDMRVECFPWVTDLIPECSLALGNELTSDEIIETIRTHPTLSESLSKTVLAAEGRPIPIPPK